MRARIVLSIICATILASGAYALTPKQAAMQSAMGGWGDIGELSIVDSPTNGGPYSLKVHWTSHPDFLNTSPFWVLSWAAPAKRYDTLSYDIMVERNNGKGNVGIYLTEADGDRWVAHPDVSKCEPGKWMHFEFKKSTMGLWGLGDNRPDWDTIVSITLEPNGKEGEITFYLDNVCMSGPSGKKSLLDPASLPRAYATPPSKAAPLNTTNPIGHAFLAGGGSFWSRPTTASALERFCSLSPSIGISSGENIGQAKLANLSSRMRNLGRPLMYETQDAQDFGVELTEAQAWGVRWDGESNNKTPGKFDAGHSACFCNPKYIEMQKRRIDAIVAGGINTLTLVDFVWAYFGGRWGYSDADVSAYRKALTGTDGGLQFIDKTGKRAISFWDYFKDYSGFVPRPQDLGFKSWSEYKPTTENAAWADKGPNRRNMHLFVTLNHWEYMKFLQTIGLYIESKGGHLWIIPNPEDLAGAEDFVYVGHLAGVQCDLPEFFGNTSWTDAIYRSGGYLAKNVHEGGHLVGPILETNAGGHGTPYYDAQVSYAVAYDLCAALHADVLKNDFLDEAPFETMSDPKNAHQFDRFRDAMSKVYAFDQYKADRPVRAKSRIALVTTRNINRYREDLFYGFGATDKTYDGCVANSLAREGFVFDLMDSIGYAPIEDYKMVFWGVSEAPPTSIDRVGKWLASDPGHVLVCHGYQPTRRNSGLYYMPWFQKQDFIEDADGGKLWGLPIISRQDGSVKGTIDLVGKPFAGAFKQGERIELPTELYVAKGGKVLLSVDGRPIVSEFIRPNGAKTIYLHYRAGEPESLAFDRRVAPALARYYGGGQTVADSVDDVIVHSYAAGVGSSHVLWARRANESFEFVYDGNRKQRLTYASPGFDATVRVPVPKPGDYILYEALSNTSTQVHAATSVPLTMKGITCAVYYVLPATPAGQAQIEKVKTNPVHDLLAGG